MRYAIRYDQSGRLRLRMGQYAFSKEEGWGIAYLLRQQTGVTQVSTCAQNGSILILYTEEASRTDLLNFVGKMRRKDIPQVEPRGEENVQAIDLTFQQICSTHSSVYSISILPFCAQVLTCVTPVCWRNRYAIPIFLKRRIAHTQT